MKKLSCGFKATVCMLIAGSVVSACCTDNDDLTPTSKDITIDGTFERFLVFSGQQ